jgi:hypothetical protein
LRAEGVRLKVVVAGTVPRLKAIAHCQIVGLVAPCLAAEGDEGAREPAEATRARANGPRPARAELIV